jgi:hypothetical protein
MSVTPGTCHPERSEGPRFFSAEAQFSAASEYPAFSLIGGLEPHAVLGTRTKRLRLIPLPRQIVNLGFADALSTTGFAPVHASICFSGSIALHILESFEGNESREVVFRGQSWSVSFQIIFAHSAANAVCDAGIERLRSHDADKISSLIPLMTSAPSSHADEYARSCYRYRYSWRSQGPEVAACWLRIARASNHPRSHRLARDGNPSKNSTAATNLNA